MMTLGSIGKRFLFLLLLLSLPCAAAAQQTEPAPGGDSGAEDTGFAEIELFTKVLEMVRQSYVDPEKTSYESLINSALEGMLADLDPHCQFMQPKVFEQLKRNTDSTYEGIGITISTKNDLITIVTAREDGPAGRAGLLAGDQILKVNNVSTQEISITEAVEMLRGRPGEPVKLTVRRPATQKVLEFEMVREVIQQSTVKDIRVLDEKLTAPFRMGYARILQFSEPTADELADGLDKLEQEGIDAFILDMRNNPGGLLGSAIDVCGEFVPAGTVVLTTEGKPGSGKIKAYRTEAERKRRDRDYPLAVLLNHSSASGAEVVGCALQDLKRCIVVGETSFGKGSVQSILPIGDGKAIRMTTAKYYTPNHRTIHENGVIPNIVAPLTPRQEVELARWFHRDTLEPEERKKVENFRDPQLIRAVDAMKGALVYSGAAKTDSREPEGTGASEKKTSSSPSPATGEKGAKGAKARAEEDGEGREEESATPGQEPGQDSPGGEPDSNPGDGDAPGDDDA